eukprot:10647-Heterococcus_DN1.PRE.2
MPECHECKLDKLLTWIDAMSCASFARRSSICVSYVLHLLFSDLFAFVQDRTMLAARAPEIGQDRWYSTPDVKLCLVWLWPSQGATAIQCGGASHRRHHKALFSLLTSSADGPQLC